MMRKIVKNIPAYFTLIAGLAIIGHMLIPHDHHLAGSEPGQKESCPVSKDKTGHHSGFPLHCHAFNDLASEKAIMFSLIRNVLNSGLITSDFTVTSELIHCNITVFNIFEPFLDSCFLDLSCLRAPPSMS
jgi:hypothetical protein